MMYWVYVLCLFNGKLYIGQTHDLQARLLRHQTGQSRYTRAYRPVELIYSDMYSSRSDAVKRESQLKKLKSSRVLQDLINANGGPIV